MIGRNYTREYKYPIKIYRVGGSKYYLEFANGLELRKLFFGLVLSIIMFFAFIVFGVKSDTNLFSFFIKNWLILLILIPSAITFITFSLNYDNKPFFNFLKDRIYFYRTKKQRFEHYINVPDTQFNKQLHYEKFYSK